MRSMWMRSLTRRSTINEKIDEESYKEKVMEEDVIKVVVKEIVMEVDKEENTHKRCLPWPSISMVQRRGHRLCLLMMLTL